MKRALYFALFFSLLSCQQKTTSSYSSEQEDDEQIPLGLRLYRDFESNGSSRLNSENDSMFVEFLKSFTTYQNQANDLLYSSPKYDIWNTLIYADIDMIKTEALAFQDSVKELGFIVSSSEGEIFLDKDPEFLQRFSPFLSDRMNRFLNEYINEIQNPFSEDGSIIVSNSEHIRRIIFWEKFEKEYPNFELPDYARNEYRYLTFRYLLGIDNTPIHDWGNPPKVRAEMLESFKQVVTEYPNTHLSELTEKFLVLLETKEYTWDSSYREFGKENFPEFYGN